MTKTTVTIPRNWPEFKPGEVLRVKNAGGRPGLWRTFENLALLNGGDRKGPYYCYSADVNTAPEAPKTNKAAPTHQAIVKMGRVA